MSKTTLKKVSDKIDIHTLNDLTLRAYWVLDRLSSPEKDRFTANEIAKYLIGNSICDTSRQAIEYALRKEKGGCNKNRQGYKLMKKGVDTLSKILKCNKEMFIDASKPYSAKFLILKDLLGDAYTEISICDPYLDINTLDVVCRNFKKGIKVRILTANVKDNPQGIISRGLTDLKQEGYDIEVRKFNTVPIHDRYIIDNTRLLYSGNSLNYLGRKESIIILLGEDTRQALLATFNSRWITAVPIN